MGSMKLERIVKMACIFLTVLSVITFALSQKVVSVYIEEHQGKDIVDPPVTFGHVFKRGEIFGGVCGFDNETKLVTQCDIKNYYDDGSVRFAVISLRLPFLAALEQREITLRECDHSSQLNASDAITEYVDNGSDGSLAFHFYNDSLWTRRGPEVQGSIKELINRSADNVSLWLSGPVCVELIVNDVHSNPHPSINVQYHVRYYISSGLTRIAPVVENVWHDRRGNVYYDVEFSIGHNPSRLVLSKDSLCHSHDARWRRVRWSSEETPRVSVKYDAGYLINTGYLPPYDLSLGTTEKVIDKIYTDWVTDHGYPGEKKVRGSRDLMSWGLIKPQQASGGVPAGQGVQTAWATLYLMSMDVRMREVMVGQGEQVGSFPSHIRNRQDSRILKIDDYPDKNPWNFFRTDELLGHTLGDMECPLRLTYDKLGPYAFMPYLITGDYYFLEEMMFLATFGLFSIWPPHRGYDKGISYGESRAAAYSSQNALYAAILAPDSWPEKSYFEEKVNNTIEYALSVIDTTDNNNVFGFYHTKKTTGRMVRDLPDTCIGVKKDSVYDVHAPWMNNYLIMTTDQMVRMGFTKAKKWRNFMLQYPVGLVVHHPDFLKYDAHPYKMIRAIKCTINSYGWRVPQSWEELYQWNFGARKKEFEPETWINYGYAGHKEQYLLHYVLAIATREKLTDAKKAYQDLHKALIDYGIDKDFRDADNPQWWVSAVDSFPEVKPGQAAFVYPEQSSTHHISTHPNNQLPIVSNQRYTFSVLNMRGQIVYRMQDENESRLLNFQHMANGTYVVLKKSMHMSPPLSSVLLK